MSKSYSIPKTVFPILKFDSFFHVGSFNPEDKKDDSYEGNGLSVSQDPNDWISVADLQGGVWKLTRDDEKKFVFAQGLSPENYHEIWHWGLENGYATLQSLYVTTYYQKGLEEEVTAEAKTKQELLDKGFGEEFISKTDNALKTTDKFISRLGWDLHWTPFILDILITFHAEDHGYEGVWWEHAHDLSRSSVPSGVIFKSKLNGWDKEQVGSVL